MCTQKHTYMYPVLLYSTAGTEKYHPYKNVYIQRMHISPSCFSYYAQFKYMSECGGLLDYADKSQLMPDLGGYLEYEHADWVRFRMVRTLAPL